MTRLRPPAPDLIRGLVVVMSAALVAVPAQAAGLRDKWLAAIEGCLTLVETGKAQLGGWERLGTGPDVHFRHESGVMISATLPMARPDKVATVCGLSFASKIPGNDQRGLVLRKALADQAEGRLEFREEDQILHPDVYRGCAWDGQQFRLSSVTQTTYASFHITLSPRAESCAALTS